MCARNCDRKLKNTPRFKFDKLSGTHTVLHVCLVAKIYVRCTLKIVRPFLKMRQTDQPVIRIHNTVLGELQTTICRRTNRSELRVKA